MSQPDFQTALNAWKLAVAGHPHAPLPQQIEAENEAQYNAWVKALASTKISANNAKYTCQFNKGGTSTRRACWIKSGAHTLKVVFVPGKRAQAVTQTSKNAFHTLDFSTQRGELARVIFLNSVAGVDITRKEIEVLYKVPSNVVTGRVNELLKLSLEAPFEFGGKLYTLTTTKDRLSICPGASLVKNEGLMWVEVIDNLPVGAQMEMF